MCLPTQPRFFFVQAQKITAPPKHLGIAWFSAQNATRITIPPMELLPIRNSIWASWDCTCFSARFFSLSCIFQACPCSFCFLFEKKMATTHWLLSFHPSGQPARLNWPVLLERSTPMCVRKRLKHEKTAVFAQGQLSLLVSVWHKLSVTFARTWQQR